MLFLHFLFGALFFFPLFFCIIMGAFAIYLDPFNFFLGIAVYVILGLLFFCNFMGIEYQLGDWVLAGFLFIVFLCYLPVILKVFLN